MGIIALGTIMVFICVFVTRLFTIGVSSLDSFNGCSMVVLLFLTGLIFVFCSVAISGVT